MRSETKSKEVKFYGKKNYNHQWGYDGNISHCGWYIGSDMAGLCSMDCRHLSYCMGRFSAYK